MTRADRYLLREFVAPFAAGLVLSVLLILSLQLQQELGGLVRSGAALSAVLERLLWRMPRVATMAVPVATALGVSLAVNRLARDNEVTILRGTGKPLARLFAPFVVAGALLAAGNLWVAERWVPEAALRSRSLSGTAGEALGAGALPDARARVLVAFQGARRLDRDRHQLERVTVVRPDALVTGARGLYRSGVLEVEDAVVHVYGSDGVTRGERAAAVERVPVTLDFVRPVSLMGSDLSDLSYAELTRLAAAAARQGDRGRALTLETARWFKVGLPTMCLAFALCAPPLALRFSRAGGFAGVLLSVVSVFVGWNTLLFLQAVSLGGWVPPAACAFATHALLAGVGLALLVAQERR